MLNETFVWVGPCPPQEDAVQINEGAELMKTQCQRYIELLRKKFGPEPTGARLMVKRSEHDFGDYFEVICEFDKGLPESIDYAFAVEENQPETWEDEDRFDWRGHGERMKEETPQE